MSNVLLRRSYVWHDFSWQNHYSREYAALASLAKIIGDTRLSFYQKKLRRSLEKIYLSDGSSNEGMAYGIYNIKLIAPYVYVTGDQEAKQYMVNFRDWLGEVADSDGWLPPFDDSRVQKLPVALSDFSFVNQYF